MKNFRSMSGTRLPRPCSAGSTCEPSASSSISFLNSILHRVGGFGGDGLQAAVDVVAGAHGAGEQVDGVGQAALRTCASRACAHADDIEDRQRARPASATSSAQDSRSQARTAQNADTARPRQQHAERRRRRRRGTSDWPGRSSPASRRSTPTHVDQVAQEREARRAARAAPGPSPRSTAAARWHAQVAQPRRRAAPRPACCGHRPDVVAAAPQNMRHAMKIRNMASEQTTSSTLLLHLVHFVEDRLAKDGCRKPSAGPGRAAARRWRGSCPALCRAG